MRGSTVLSSFLHTHTPPPPPPPTTKPSRTTERVATKSPPNNKERRTTLAAAILRVRQFPRLLEKTKIRMAQLIVHAATSVCQALLPRTKIQCSVVKIMSPKRAQRLHQAYSLMVSDMLSIDYAYPTLASPPRLIHPYVFRGGHKRNYSSRVVHPPPRWREERCG